jgi:hypothetical protein
MPMHDPQAAREWRAANLDMSRTVEGRIDRSAVGLAAMPGPLAAMESAAGGFVERSGTAAPGVDRSPDVPVTVVPPEDPDAPPEPSDTAEYRAARARRERTRADREELELEQLRGKLADVEELARIAGTVARALRDAILNVPVRIADQVAAETDRDRVEQLLDAELTSALDAFDLAAAVRNRDDGTGLDDDDEAAA